MFQEAKFFSEQSVLRSKVDQGVECVEEQSELGCKMYQATQRKSVPREQTNLGSRVCVIRLTSIVKNKMKEVRNKSYKPHK